jgi:hypothetical protein
MDMFGPAEAIREWALAQVWLWFAHDSIRGLDPWVIYFFVGSLGLFVLSLLMSMVLGAWRYRPDVTVSEPMLPPQAPMPDEQIVTEAQTETEPVIAAPAAMVETEVEPAAAAAETKADDQAPTPPG